MGADGKMMWGYFFLGGVGTFMISMMCFFDIF